jgi:membrane protease YdiL (CAAX protease family)
MSRFTDSKGKLQPIWAFVFSFLLSALAFFVSGNIAHEAAETHPFRVEFIFRPLWAFLLLAIFIWLLTVGDHIEEHRIAAQGLPRTRGWLKQFVLGILLGCVLTTLAVAPIHFYGSFRTVNLMALRLLPNLAAVLMALLCGALAEELMFRGYPFQHLEKAIGTVPTVISFSIIYGLLHFPLNPLPGIWGIVNTVMMGILFSVAYLRTRALWLPWGIHFGWNLTLGLLFGLPLSGFRNYNLLRYTQAYGPEWLTGGKYGVEASMTGAAAIVVGLILVSTLPFRKLMQPELKTAPETALHDSLSGIKS